MTNTNFTAFRSVVASVIWTDPNWDNSVSNLELKASFLVVVGCGPENGFDLPGPNNLIEFPSFDSNNLSQAVVCPHLRDATIQDCIFLEHEPDCSIIFRNLCDSNSWMCFVDG
jgi:hypothetical protein